MKRAMGLNEDNVPLGHKDDDIFQMVHDHYQSMRAQGAFYEQEHIIEVSSNF
jgi:hypothetical protein